MTTTIQAKNRVQDVTESFYFGGTHPIRSLKKTGPETLPLAMPHVELHSELY